MNPSTQTPMGKVETTLKVANRLDQADAKRGYITPEEVRSMTLTEVLVDTGATLLCLPSEVIATLGLELLKEVNVATATGLSKARIFRDASVSIMGREGTFECLELPGGREPLIGVVPLETLGIELDLKNRQLKLLPDDSMDTYLTIF